MATPFLSYFVISNNLLYTGSAFFFRYRNKQGLYRSRRAKFKNARTCKVYLSSTFHGLSKVSQTCSAASWVAIFHHNKVFKNRLEVISLGHPLPKEQKNSHQCSCRTSLVVNYVRTVFRFALFDFFQSSITSLTVLGRCSCTTSPVKAMLKRPEQQ